MQRAPLPDAGGAPWSLGPGTARQLAGQPSPRREAVPEPEIDSVLGTWRFVHTWRTCAMRTVARRRGDDHPYLRPAVWSITHCVPPRPSSSSSGALASPALPLCCGHGEDHAMAQDLLGGAEGTYTSRSSGLATRKSVSRSSFMVPTSCPSEPVAGTSHWSPTRSEFGLFGGLVRSADPLAGGPGASSTSLAGDRLATGPTRCEDDQEAVSGSTLLKWSSPRAAHVAGPQPSSSPRSA
jgi:hypothetical protein